MDGEAGCLIICGSGFLFWLVGFASGLIFLGPFQAIGVGILSGLLGLVFGLIVLAIVPK